MTERSLHRLTAKKVENLKNTGRYADGGGLYLQITPTKTKSWLFRFTLDGKAREMGLGALHTVTLSEAREKAQDARRMLQEALDPIEARGAARSAERLADAKSKAFKECAEEYIKAHRAAWRNAKHAAQWASTLETYCYPVFGDFPVAGVDATLVLEVLEPIWESKTETASRLRGRIESILDWATVRGYREGLNPARWKGHLDQTLPKRSKVAKVRHHPALPFAEASAFIKRLRKLDGVAPRALEYIILTAARTGEAIGARWPEIDLKAAAWTIPGTRMKTGRDHKVPLSDAAIAVLKSMKKIAHGEYVFPGPGGKKPLSNMACLAVLERLDRDDITVHGFRSTFRDWAAERTNFPREVVEMALAHVVEDKTEAAYRRGDLFDKRRRLMDSWAQFCEKPTSATVHSIESRRAIRA